MKATADNPRFSIFSFLTNKEVYAAVINITLEARAERFGVYCSAAIQAPAIKIENRVPLIADVFNLSEQRRIY
jgi:hypothetical protein